MDMFVISASFPKRGYLSTWLSTWWFCFVSGRAGEPQGEGGVGNGPDGAKRGVGEGKQERQRQQRHGEN